MTEIGRAELTVIPSFKGGQRSLEKQLGITGSKAGGFNASGKAAGGAFIGGFRSIMGPAAAILSTGLAVDFASDAINEASDLGESVNALDVVFKDASKGIQALGRDAASSLGLSNLDFNNLAVQFSGFVKTIAADGGDYIGTIDDLTTRAADFASVMNLDVADAAQLFQSGLAGESEPLRRYSIDLSAAAVDAFAYASGIAKTGEQLTEAQKVQARYGLLMQETNQTAGDFANTSDSLANRQRILAAEWDNMRAELGERLLPVMQDVTGWLLDEGLPGLSGFIDDLDDPSTRIGGIAKALEDLWTEVEPGLAAAWETGGSFAEMLLGGLADGIGTANRDGWGQVWEDWLDGAAIAGGELSAWAESGDSAAQQFIHGFDLVMKSFAEGTVAEDFANGVGDMTLEGLQSAYQNYAVWLDSIGISNPIVDRLVEDARDAQPTQPGKPYTGGGLGPTYPAGFSDMSPYAQAFYAPTIDAIEAAADASWGNPTVSIGVVYANDTEDIVRKAQKSARSNKWSGSRNGAGIDPRLTR